MMNFKYEDKNKVEFGYLAYGATFIDRDAFEDDRVFMKVKLTGFDCEVVSDTGDRIYGAAIDLNNGELYTYDEDTEVISVDCDTTVKIK